MKLKSFDKLPQEWERSRLEHCFTLVSQITTQHSDSTIEVREDDIILEFDRKNNILKCDISTQDAHISSNRKTILRSNNKYNPHLFKHLVQNTYFNKFLVDAILVDGLIFPSVWRGLKDVEIVVPPKDVQDKMLKTISISSDFLNSYADNIDRQSQIIRKLSNSLVHEIILDKIDQKQAVSHLKPLLNKPQEETISLAEHKQIVKNLQEKIKELESKENKGKFRP